MKSSVSFAIEIVVSSGNSCGTANFFVKRGLKKSRVLLGVSCEAKTSGHFCKNSRATIEAPAVFV